MTFLNDQNQLSTVANYIYRTDSTGLTIYNLVQLFKSVKEDISTHLPEATGVRFGNFEDLLKYVEYDDTVTTLPDLATLLGDESTAELVKYTKEEVDKFTNKELRQKLRVNETTYNEKDLNWYVSQLVSSYDSVKNSITTLELEKKIAKKVRKDFKEAYTFYHSYYKQYENLNNIVADASNGVLKNRIKNNVEFTEKQTVETLTTLLQTYETEVMQAFNDITAITRVEDDQLEANENKRYKLRPVDDLKDNLDIYKPMKLHYTLPLDESVNPYMAIDPTVTPYPTSTNEVKPLEELLINVSGEKGITKLLETINTLYNTNKNDIKEVLRYETELHNKKEELKTFRTNPVVFADDITTARNYNRDTDKQEVANMIDRFKYYITTLKALIKIKDKGEYSTLDNVIKSKLSTYMYASNLETFPIVAPEHTEVEPSEDESQNNYNTDLGSTNFDDLDDLRKAQYCYKHLQTVYVQKASLRPEDLNKLRSNYNSFLSALSDLRSEVNNRTLSSMVTEAGSDLGGVI